MDQGLGQNNLPDLRDFLDKLPQKPCSSKLPDEYCKICRRLNGEVASYCRTKKLPEKPKEEKAGEEIPFERPEKAKDEEPPEPKGQRGMPILQHPTYRDGETSLEFVPSQRMIDQARKNLPRFIPVHRGPRSFRPLEEETSFELESFSASKPSLFRSASSLDDEDEDMMFSLASDDAIEVVPIEVLNEGQIASETVYSGADGVVEVVEIVEEQPFVSFEDEDVPAFQFMPQDDSDIIEAEIVEAEIVEEPPQEIPTVAETPQEEIAKTAESMEFEFKPTEGDVGVEEQTYEPTPELKFEPTAPPPGEKVPEKPERGFMKKRLKIKKKKKRFVKAPEPAPEPVPFSEQEPSFDLDAELESVFSIQEEGEGGIKEKEESTGDLIPGEGDFATLTEISDSEAPPDESAANLYMCPSCGAFVSSQATLCLQCGYDFEAEEEAPIPQKQKPKKQEKAKKPQEDELSFEPMTVDSHEDAGTPFDEEELKEITQLEELEDETESAMSFDEAVKEDEEVDSKTEPQEALSEEIEEEMDVPFSEATEEELGEAQSDETEPEMDAPFKEPEPEPEELGLETKPKEDFLEETETESIEPSSPEEKEAESENEVTFEEPEPEMDMAFEDALKEEQEPPEPEPELAPPEDIAPEPEMEIPQPEPMPEEELELTQEPELEFKTDEQEEIQEETPTTEENAPKKLKKVKLKKKKKLKLKKVKKSKSKDDSS